MTERPQTGTWEPKAPERGPEHRRVEVCHGKWINEGETVPMPDAPAAKIVTSDVYQWIRGRFSVRHTAYGCIGDLDDGGVEIIGYDVEGGRYTSHFLTARAM